MNCLTVQLIHITETVTIDVHAKDARGQARIDRTSRARRGRTGAARHYCARVVPVPIQFHIWKRARAHVALDSYSMRTQRSRPTRK